jgi:3',5'-cyclic-AMP phosphodiesterase
MLLAQLTDCHLKKDPDDILRGWHTDRSFHLVIELLRSLDPMPDHLLLTGDLSEDGAVEAYQRILKAVESVGIPFSWLPGNHDHLENMSQVFPASPKYFVQDGWQFVLLNSTAAGDDGGTMSSSELDFASRSVVDDGSLHTAIALHHHALPINSRWMDEIYPLRNAPALRSSLETINSCQVVFFGHIHQDFDRTHHHIRYLGCPATADQFLPNSDQHLSDTSVLPGLRLTKLHPNGDIDTRIVRIPSLG